MATLRVALAGLVSDTGEVRVGARVRLHVRSLAAGGAGVAALPDGRVVFVHRTAPGDVVEAVVTRLKKRWGQAELVEVVEAGPHRVDAPCPLYDRCGGCTLQHLPYEEQLAWKARFVTDALERIGGLDVAPPEVLPSPATVHYRNRVTFTVRKLSASRVVGGFHALERPDHVVDVDEGCLLPEPAILRVWAALRDAWRRGLRPLPPGKELRVTLRSVESDAVVLVVQGGAGGWDPTLLLEVVPGLAAVWHHAAEAAAPVCVSGETVHEAWEDERVPVGGHAFLQVNRQAARPLVAHVLAQAGDGGRAVDAYCGVGVYGRALARRGWQVTGIEADAEACRAARHDAPHGFDVVEAKVEEALPSLLPAELVILNPPRSGLQEWVPGMLTHHLPGRVVYVSCDPATLARDAAPLQEAYETLSLRSFDLFPQTHHVETVAVFQRRRVARRN